MAVALPISKTEMPTDIARRIWISEIDPTGQRVDPAFIEAAYRKENDLFRLRRREFPDDARVADLIEEAVYRASRAVRNEPVRDPGGYLYRVYSNLLDEEIVKEIRTVNSEDQFLEHLAGSANLTTDVTDQIYGRQLLEAMDPETRFVWEKRLLGYGVQDIAREIEVTPDCLSTRIRRGTKEALKRLFRDEVR
jgi:DNA-directed RNA polymerase specialized sigma24 family protein